MTRELKNNLAREGKMRTTVLRMGEVCLMAVATGLVMLAQLYLFMNEASHTFIVYLEHGTEIIEDIEVMDLSLLPHAATCTSPKPASMQADSSSFEIGYLDEVMAVHLSRPPNPCKWATPLLLQMKVPVFDIGDADDTARSAPDGAPEIVSTPTGKGAVR